MKSLRTIILTLAVAAVFLSAQSASCRHEVSLDSSVVKSIWPSDLHLGPSLLLSKSAGWPARRSQKWEPQSPLFRFADSGAPVTNRLPRRMLFTSPPA